LRVPIFLAVTLSGGVDESGASQDLNINQLCQLMAIGSFITQNGLAMDIEYFRNF